MYTNTICEYKDFMVQPTSGVRQGDYLSPIIFNLASEPIIRKAIEIAGYDLFGSKAKLTAYADYLAIITGSHEEMVSVLDGILEVSSSIGLKFNPRKCTSISTRGLLRIGSLCWVKNLLKLSILANLKDSWIYQLDLSSCLMLY